MVIIIINIIINIKIIVIIIIIFTLVLFAIWHIHIKSLLPGKYVGVIRE